MIVFNLIGAGIGCVIFQRLNAQINIVSNTPKKNGAAYSFCG